MGLVIFLLSVYFLCSEGSGKTLITMMVLELLAVSSAGVYAFSGGNMGFLFVIFCMMGVEVSVLVSIFVSVVRHKGDTRVTGASLDGVEWG
uniref:NADH dehydrogenase subunit 4L n=1 Tax=Pinctada maxima TaxID=104660 RepID=J9PCE7_PINMA|nr:NADH dehydrogenase subunit 4L [Pinctada maxima]